MHIRAVALSLTALALLSAAPYAAACCVHTTQTVAWSEYVVVDGSLVCIAPSSPAIVDTDGCLLFTSYTAYRLEVADVSGKAVHLAWTGQGADCEDVGGTGVGAVEVELPAGCDHVVLRMGPGAMGGVIRRA